MKVFAVYEVDRYECDIKYTKALFLHESDAKKYLQDLENLYQGEELMSMPDFWVSEVEVQESYTPRPADPQDEVDQEDSEDVEWTIYRRTESGTFCKVSSVLTTVWEGPQNAIDRSRLEADPDRPELYEYAAQVGDHIEGPDGIYEVTADGYITIDLRADYWSGETDYQQ